MSIPGAVDAANGAANVPADIEARFFNVVRQHNPDVVVLDLTTSQGSGIPAIVKIRRRTGVPILVVCGAEDPQMREYLKSISPVTRASELRKPTLLIQAGKDTRVPGSHATESNTLL